jgi:hypothetical protein
MRRDENTGRSFMMDGKPFRVKRFIKCSGKHKHIDGIPLFHITLECKYTGEISIDGKMNEMILKTTPSFKEAGK